MRVRQRGLSGGVALDSPSMSGVCLVVAHWVPSCPLSLNVYFLSPAVCLVVTDSVSSRR